MTEKHTPGPWRYVRENGSPTTGPHMIVGAIPGYLAEVRDCGSGDVAANARLISAAPELLAALRAARHYVVCQDALGADLLRIDAVIAKALGEQP